MKQFPPTPGARLASAAYSRSKSASHASRSVAAHKSGKTPKRKGPKANAKAPLGQGGRFAAMKQKLAKRPGVTNPGALAAFIGRKKYGGSAMASMAAAGRK